MASKTQAKAAKAAAKIAEWRSGHAWKADPAKTLVVFEKLQDSGKLTAARLVDEAVNTASPLHNDFEWDDEVAAHQHRLQTARTMIRALHVTYKSGQTGPAETLVKEADTGALVYMPTETVIAVPDAYGSAVELLLREVISAENALSNLRAAMAGKPLGVNETRLRVISEAFAIIRETTRALAS